MDIDEKIEDLKFQRSILKLQANTSNNPDIEGTIRQRTIIGGEINHLLRIKSRKEKINKIINRL